MAGKYGSASIAITFDDAPGGSPQTITPYVREISGIKVEAISEESNPFGTAWGEHTPTGMSKIEDITIKGFFNTTATVGPHVVFGAPDNDPQDALRTFTFAPGDSKVFTVEARLASYSVMGTNGALTQYEAVIRPSGSGAWS